MITENNLKELDFEKVDVTIEESGDAAFCYYTLELGNDYEKFCLISSEIEENKPIKVQIFNYDSFNFTTVKELTKLIALLKSSIKN